MTSRSRRGTDEGPQEARGSSDSDITQQEPFARRRREPKQDARSQPRRGRETSSHAHLETGFENPSPTAGDEPIAATARTSVATFHETRGRLRDFARFMSWSGAILVIGIIPLVLTGWLQLATWWPILCLLVSVFILSSVLAALEQRPYDDRTVFVSGHVYVVLVSGIAGFAHAAIELQRYGLATPFGPHILIIALFPLLLSSTVTIAVVTALLATIAALLGMALSSLFESGMAAADLAPDVIGAPFAAVAVAILLARRLANLRSQVVEARQLGSYQLHQRLGEGGMGEVWRATHQLLARPTAVKVIHPSELAANPQRRVELLERFRREARITAALSSNHTVRLFDFGQTDGGSFFFAMELLDGVDLQRLVDQYGRLPAERVRRFLLHACDSLGEAHQLGLMHRDIKPANMMVCRQGRRVDVLKVLDFGIAALIDPPTSSDNLTRPGALIGTPSYMAPEVLGRGSVDQRSDLYSLGCVGYWLLTGRRVFEDASPMLEAAAQLRDPVPPPSALGIDVPGELEAALMHCLQKRAEDRPSSADQFAETLSSFTCSPDWDESRARTWWNDHGPRLPSKHLGGQIHTPHKLNVTRNAVQ